MECKNGVSELIGKMLSHKSGGSAHSTQQCSKLKKQEPSVTRPYMAESCGGCDDHDEEIFGLRTYGLVGGLN